MRFNFTKKGAIEEPQINLTALIDVVFVILIMFILIAPLLEMDRVELADASGDKSVSVQESSPLTIHVHRNNQIFVNKEPTELSQLTEKLKKAKKVFPTIRPQLFHDRKAEFGTYQAVKSALESAGYTEVDIVLKP